MSQLFTWRRTVGRCVRIYNVHIFKFNKQLFINFPSVIKEQSRLTYFQHKFMFQQGKFQNMSEQIIGRIDDMGCRLDELGKLL